MTPSTVAAMLKQILDKSGFLLRRQPSRMLEARCTNGKQTNRCGRRLAKVQLPSAAVAVAVTLAVAVPAPSSCSSSSRSSSRSAEAAEAAAVAALVVAVVAWQQQQQ